MRFYENNAQKGNIINLSEDVYDQFNPLYIKVYMI